MVEHGITGLVSPVGDADMMAHHLGLLLQEESYRKQLGVNAKRWGESHWSLDLMIARMLAIYNKAIEKAGGRHGVF